MPGREGRGLGGPREGRLGEVGGLRLGQPKKLESPGFPDENKTHTWIKVNDKQEDIFIYWQCVCVYVQFQPYLQWSGQQPHVYQLH